jgi:hypothetical protein
VDVADLHSELQDKPAHFLDILVADASLACPGILTVVTVSVVGLGAMVVFFFWEMIIRRLQDQKIQDHQDRLRTIFESWLVGWSVGWFYCNWFDFTGVSISVPLMKEDIKSDCDPS